MKMGGGLSSFLLAGSLVVSSLARTLNGLADRSDGVEVCVAGAKGEGGCVMRLLGPGVGDRAGGAGALSITGGGVRGGVVLAGRGLFPPFFSGVAFLFLLPFLGGEVEGMVGRAGGGGGPLNPGLGRGRWGSRV